MVLKSMLDLIQLYAVSPDLYLVVFTADEFYSAVFQPPAQVAGAVHALTGTERI